MPFVRPSTFCLGVLGHTDLFSSKALKTSFPPNTKPTDTVIQPPPPNPPKPGPAGVGRPSHPEPHIGLVVPHGVADALGVVHRGEGRQLAEEGQAGRIVRHFRRRRGLLRERQRGEGKRRPPSRKPRSERGNHALENGQSPGPKPLPAPKPDPHMELNVPLPTLHPNWTYDRKSSQANHILTLKCLNWATI